MSVLFSAYPFLRPLLFSLDAEAAHDLTLPALAKVSSCALTRRLVLGKIADNPVRIMGLNLKNPVGLAAGLDKNGAYIDALGSLGFGFLEVGTVTPLAQSGNPKPRLFRLPRSQALINRFGFNNLGLEAFIENIKKSRWRSQGGILGLNIGKNAHTPASEAINDYLLGLEAVYLHADYITVNISSPNTENLRNLQSGDELIHLLQALKTRREALQQQYGYDVPLVIKIAPDLNPEQVDAIAAAVINYGVNGVIATNTTLARDAVVGQPHANEAGGLSGPPVHALSLPVIERLRSQLGPDFAIIGVGGIASGKQAQEKIAAGANAVQLYTGLIYRGPKLIAECAQALQS